MMLCALMDPLHDVCVREAIMDPLLDVCVREEARKIERKRVREESLRVYVCVRE